METCTFFGHGDTPRKIAPILKSALIDLIENKNVCNFYVGNHGNFDNLVKEVLEELKCKYPHINYAVVLSYLPNNKEDFDYRYTVYPDGLENVPLKYAICKRNEWMIKESHYVITYVTYNFGGAYKYKKLAEKKKRVVINLADTE